jgi:tetratricopeptide (TPR) repeat protein
MPSPKDEARPCWYCQKRPATEKYTHAGRTKMVCATCLDRLEVQDELEEGSIHIDELTERGQSDEALACLDAFGEANRHRDHDRWLARSVAKYRAFILHRAGRYAEALHAYEAVEQLGFENVTDRWAHGLAKARTLQGLGKHKEALAVFEDAFSHQEPRFAGSAPYFFDVLVELSKKLGRPVDEKWRSVAAAAAEDYGIEMPVRDSLGKTMLAIRKITRKMPPRRAREWQQKQKEAKGDEP